MRVGSTTNARAWAYSRNASLSFGSVASALSTMAFMLSRDHHREHPAKEHPGGLEPGDHVAQRLAVGRPDEHVPRIHRGEDQPLHHPPTAILGIGEQAQPAEINLQFSTRLAVGHPHRALTLPKPQFRVA